jgi:hypothetical protein
MRTELRVQALEARLRAAAGAVKFVWRESGETEADALTRAGYQSDSTGRVIVFSWRDKAL